MKTDNELIAKFMGYEIVVIDYFGTKDATEWQIKHEDWLENVGLEYVGKYLVKVDENEFIDWDDVYYSASYEQFMPVWVKFRDLKLSERHGDKHKQWVRAIGYTILNKTLEDACSHLVMGIKWYNEVKPLTK